MTEYVLSPPDQIVQHMATGIVDSIRRDPKLRESLREILLTGESDAWVGQRGSPLGPRRHRAAVERHVAAGEPRARIAGRRYELRRDLLDEVLL